MPFVRQSSFKANSMNNFNDPTLTRLTVTTSTKQHLQDPKSKSKFIGGGDDKQLLKIITTCNEFSKVEKSNDYKFILSDIKTNRYLYDLLLFLYLNLLKNIISFKKSNKK